MRIVTWNCNGALRTKFEHLEALNGDIYIIQECENPKECAHQKYQLWADNHLWIGEPKHKGLAIIAKPSIRLTALDWTCVFKDHTVKYFLPCRINNDFQLLGVWTHQNNSPNFGYIGQFWKYLQLNKTEFDKIIIAGDFNSNAIWDEWDRWWNHTDVINELEKLDIKSVYHCYFNEQPGKERQPTFFLQRNIQKPYHIDYILGSACLLGDKHHLSIGSIEDWIKISDHLPVCLDL